MIKCLRAVNYVAALACLFGFVDLLRNADASPTPFRETIPLNSQILIQPEYVENLARELEKDSARNNLALIWQRYKLRMLHEPDFGSGNLDPIGGGNLLKRSLNSANGDNNVPRSFQSQLTSRLAADVARPNYWE